MCKKDFKGNTTNFEKMLLKFFRKLLQVSPNSTQERAIFGALKTALETLDDVDKKTLGYEEFYVWIKMMGK